MRTRDASVATIRYDNGLTAGALTLFEAITVQREQSATSAYGLLSLFGDGRWSLQGALEGSRRSRPVPASPGWSPLFRALRGEVALNVASTAQAGFMPTLQTTGHARLLFEHDNQGGRAGAAIARSFDGRFWQTTVLSDASLWRRRGATLHSMTTTLMQLGRGDMLADVVGGAEWSRGRSFYAASLGTRLGESERGTVTWGSFTVTLPLRPDLWTTFSVGTYPADLVQNLPGGRFLAFTLRLPNGRWPEFRRRPLPPPPPPDPPVLPVTERLALVMGHSLDSLHLREIRVWAPGATLVELVADFVDWIPVPLIRQPNGEWRGFYRVPPGLHRLNLRLDRVELDVPMNWPAEKDDFLGAVGVVIVR